MMELAPHILAGQVLGLIALALCIVAFASRDDDRLFVVLILANAAFAAHFMLLQSWVAAGITCVIVLRIVLVRRYKGSWRLMVLLLAMSVVTAMLTWQRPLDILPLSATVLGTFGMFMLRGIPMRLLLAGGALLWMLNNLLIGSIGGTLAEALILVTNLITVTRLARAGRRVTPG